MSIISGKLTDRKLVILIAIAGIAIIVFKKFGITDEVQAVIGIASLLSGYFGNKIQKKGKSKVDEVKDYLDNKHHISPEIAILYIVGYMQLSERAVAWIINYGIEKVSVGANNIIQINVITSWSGAFLIIPIAIFISHRLRRSQIRWTVLALYINQLITVLTILLVYPSIYKQLLNNNSLQFFLLDNFIAGIFILIPGTLIGYFWAKQTKTVFIMDQIFQKLPIEEQKQLIQLASTLPSISKNDQEGQV